MSSEPGIAPLTSSWPSRLIDPRAAIALATLYVVAVVAVPLAWWRTLGGLALGLAFVIGVLGITPRAILGRWMGLLLFVAFISGTAAFASAERARLGLIPTALAMAAKSALAAATMLTLTSAYPFIRLLAGLRGLHAPGLFVDSLYFMERFRYLLVDELDRMMIARRARTFRRSSLAWGLLTGLLGGLFLRTLERSLRVHDAMLSRGWTGELKVLDE